MVDPRHSNITSEPTGQDDGTSLYEASLISYGQDRVEILDRSKKFLVACSGFRDLDSDVERRAFDCFLGEEVDFGRGMRFRLIQHIGVGDDRRTFLAEHLDNSGSRCALKVSRSVDLSSAMSANEASLREPQYILINGNPELNPRAPDFERIGFVRSNLREIAALCMLESDDKCKPFFPEYIGARWVNTGMEKSCGQSCVIAVEHIQGVTFYDFMKREFAATQDLPKLCGVLASVAEGLANAAEQGVYIQDCNWGNFLVRSTQTGHPQAVIIDLQQAVFPRLQAAQRITGFAHRPNQGYIHTEKSASDALHTEFGYFLDGVVKAIYQKNSSEVSTISNLASRLKNRSDSTTLRDVARELKVGTMIQAASESE